MFARNVLHPGPLWESDLVVARRKIRRTYRAILQHSSFLNKVNIFRGWRNPCLLSFHNINYRIIANTVVIRICRSINSMSYTNECEHKRDTHRQRNCRLSRRSSYHQLRENATSPARISEERVRRYIAGNNSRVRTLAEANFNRQSDSRLIFAFFRRHLIGA